MRTTILVATLLAGCVTEDGSDDPMVIDESGKEDGAGLVNNPNVALGAPKDSSPQDDLVIVRSQYVNSYNKYTNGPNWVAWHLSAGDVGTVSRQNDFRADASLPSSLRVTPADYQNQGYDRGHMCNSEDRSNTLANNQATFLMSNMLPQRHQLNAGPWEGLEEYSRSLAINGSDLFIIAGGAFSADCSTHVSGAGNAPASKCATIGERTARIAVPDSTWKVIVVVPHGAHASDVTAKSRVIAVDMPNAITDPSHDWTPYVTTAEAIERKTGYTFFRSLPADVAAALRTQHTSGGDVTNGRAEATTSILEEEASKSQSLPCDTHDACNTCLEDPRCGWCGPASTGACVEGTNDGPTTGTCEMWDWIEKECR